ncbi:hypothetical protein AGABI1DRAFT_124850 [Agaricus bisporus var. burnettii JB137-S8]|uniref:Uncharacterized protein n=1 Tax=Agaricus bisporus var. burnettii (strain JB137-S8 / ATCC MYA-4627 / FGSC 10392) TaxID=597362 RepID=K5X3F2_AGABU|nr:uncharacterized protein AGABI1DRAFT_124850 [Agaricus bisporus var. burnettii JB137-S8]EKM82376.1 hypothetical protein AGABI1DRAFT_124850 [Agaricus bisporus var. burnettii JB137-S8]
MSLIVGHVPYMLSAIVWPRPHSGLLDVLRRKREKEKNVEVLIHFYDDKAKALSLFIGRFKIRQILKDPDSFHRSIVPSVSSRPPLIDKFSYAFPERNMYLSLCSRNIHELPKLISILGFASPASTNV